MEKCNVMYFEYSCCFLKYSRMMVIVIFLARYQYGPADFIVAINNRKIETPITTDPRPTICPSSRESSKFHIMVVIVLKVQMTI